VLYQLSYGPLTNIPLWLLPFANGQGQSRTADTAVFSRVLYHLSYLARPYHFSPTRRTPHSAAFDQIAGAGFEPATFGL
jgi:hypothetical protein